MPIFVTIDLEIARQVAAAVEHKLEHLAPCYFETIPGNYFDLADNHGLNLRNFQCWEERFQSQAKSCFNYWLGCQRCYRGLKSRLTHYVARCSRADLSLVSCYFSAGSWYSKVVEYPPQGRTFCYHKCECLMVSKTSTACLAQFCCPFLIRQSLTQTPNQWLLPSQSLPRTSYGTRPLQWVPPSSLKLKSTGLWRRLFRLLSKQYRSKMIDHWFVAGSCLWE